MKKLIFILLGLSIIVIIGASYGTETQPLALSIDEQGIVNNNTDRNDISGVAILAVNEKSLDDLIQAQIANDKLGYSQMLGSGRLFIVDNGTAVKVINTKFAKTEVRILEGKHLGKSGWIAYEFVIFK